MDLWVQECMEGMGRGANFLGSRSELGECGLELGCYWSGCLRGYDRKPSLKSKEFGMRATWTP